MSYLWSKIIHCKFIYLLLLIGTGNLVDIYCSPLGMCFLGIS